MFLLYGLHVIMFPKRTEKKHYYVEWIKKEGKKGSVKKG